MKYCNIPDKYYYTLTVIRLHNHSVDNADKYNFRLNHRVCYSIGLLLYTSISDRNGTKYSTHCKTNITYWSTMYVFLQSWYENGKKALIWQRQKVLAEILYHNDWARGGKSTAIYIWYTVYWTLFAWSFIYLGRWFDYSAFQDSVIRGDRLKDILNGTCHPGPLLLSRIIWSTIGIEVGQSTCIYFNV